nr:unnamed protein product [Callosobruchus chinensis]
MQDLTPVQLFEWSFDDEVINIVVEFTSRYALQRNSDIAVCTTEMRNDAHNIMVTEAEVKRQIFTYIEQLEFRRA